MPEPVPRSRARPTGSRTVSPASVVDAPPTPSTSRPGPRRSASAADAARAADRAAQVGDDPPVLAVVARVRAYVHGGAPHLAAVRASQPAVGQAAVERGQGGAAARAYGTGRCSRKSRTSVSSGRAAAGGAQGGDGLAAGQRRVGGRAEQVEAAVGGEGGGQQASRSAGRRGRWRGRGGGAYSRPPLSAGTTARARRARAVGGRRRAVGGAGGPDASRVGRARLGRAARR